MYHIIAAYALLASAISTNTIILKSLPAGIFVGMRMFIAGLVLVGLRSYKNERFRWNYLKKDWALFLAISLFTTCIPSLLKAYGLKHMISSKAAFLGSVDPFITALYDYLIWGAVLSMRQIGGMLIGSIGIILHIIITAPEEQQLLAFSIVSYPELAALGSMAIGRLGWMMVQHLVRTDRYHPTEVTGLTMLLSGAVTIPLALLYEDPHPLIHLLQPSIACLVLYTILAGNIFGYSLYTHALKHSSATLVSLCGVSIPLFVYLYGGFFVGESFNPTFLITFPITALGVFIFYSDKKLLP